MYKAYTAPVKELAEFKNLKSKLGREQGMVAVTGCADSEKANLIYALTEGQRRVVIVAENELKAKQFFEDYRFYHKNTYYYPPKDLLFYQADIRSNVLDEERIAVLRALTSDETAAVVLPAAALMDKITPKIEFLNERLIISAGCEISLEKAAETLAALGYERCAQCQGPGQFAIRGDILDIYPVTGDDPVRIDLFGDEVETIKLFDRESQRSIEEIREAVIYPANDHGHPEGTLLSYFDPETTLFVIDEPDRVRESTRATEEEFRESIENRIAQGNYVEGMIPDIYGAEEVKALLGKFSMAGLCALDVSKGSFKIRERIHIETQPVSSYNNSFELLTKDLTRYKEKGYRVMLISASRTRANRLAKQLTEEGLIAFYSEDTDREVKPGEILVQDGYIAKGFTYPMAKFVIITEADIFGKKKKKRRKKTEYSGQKISTFSELSIGDYVVHESYGLGIYRGIQKITVDGVLKDYAKLEYAGSNLYVLATQLDMLQKYASADADKKPRLNKIGGQEWKNTKARVKKAVADIAKDLVDLYAARQTFNGFRYGEDTVWQKEFEEMFPYEETEDQLKAIEDTKHDMESERIMDRLICGDVGYGKTEVALRAAFKAVQENKQVAYLVPTTILSQQHYNTFVERLKDFPVRVDLLCRFRTPAQISKTIKDIKSGLVDIVIGTHRLLSKDVVFKDLGLLVIDEEQRFGVTHKEKIKKLRNNVDVLTLTATPIPRTLHMSLIGIRDMSVLEEPPEDRQPIQTYVCEYNQEIVREAICRELARNGQVYYVYNRVQNIAEVASVIKELVPEAEVAYADGQMREADLERVMIDFINHDVDVLVTTTIIETGLDIPNVNTIIIQDSDRMGLSQLYQLRGRVGRSNRNAYAFLMYRRGRMLKETAEKRLLAIREFTELGSGFKIAMRDLEIRGAGNLLGAEQHGHMDAVGYDLYCKMLSDAVGRLKGEKVTEDFETLVDLPIDAFIPAEYIEDEYQKLDAYKRIAGIDGDKDFEDMEEELEDRFGEMPIPVKNLLLIANLKAYAHKASLTEIKIKGGELQLAINDNPSFDPAKLPMLIDKYKGKVAFKMYPAGNYFVFPREDDIRKTIEKLKIFCIQLAGL